MDQLRRLAKDRRDALDRVAQVDAQIAAEVRKLQESGKPMHELATIIGMSRQALYDLLRRSDS
jgi:hypothetical protein